MAGEETAVYVSAGSTSSGARARSGTRRRRRRRRVRRGEETRRRGIRRRTKAAVLVGEPSRRNMAAGCCGAKKQRLGGGGAAPSLSSCDGTVIRHGVPRPRKPMSIAQPEMGFFCFDVLYCQLHQLDPPKAPNFSNEALWVALSRCISPSSVFFYARLCVRPSVPPSRRVSCWLRLFPMTHCTSCLRRACPESCDFFRLNFDAAAVEKGTIFRLIIYLFIILHIYNYIFII